MNISLYLDEPLLEKMRRKAKAQKISLSKFAQEALASIVENNERSITMKNLAALSGTVALGGDAVKESESCYE